MQPNSNVPAGSHGNTPAPNAPKADSPLTKTEPISGPIGSSYGSQSGKRPGDDGIQAILDSGKQAAEKGDKWLAAHDVADAAKDLGSKALHGVKTLSTGQLALGIGVLAAGIAFFITKGKNKYPKVGDQRKSRRKNSGKEGYFDHQPHTVRGNDLSHRGQRPFSTSRYGAEGNPGGRGRVQAGSGYEGRGNRRRDQGPASGNRYDARAGGRQNPNNLDQLGSAY